MEDLERIDPLADEDIVVRFGIKPPVADLYEAVLDNVDAGAGPVLSVFANNRAAEEDDADLVFRICSISGMPHNQIQVSKASVLRSFGITIKWEVGPEEPPNHHHVYFQEPVAQSQVQGFQDAFGDPEPNPVPKKDRKR